MVAFGRVATLSIVGICVLAGVLGGCATSGGGAANPLAGSWALYVDWGAGESDMVLEVNADMTGTIEDVKEGWTSALSNVTVEGDAASFRFGYGGSGENNVEFKGTVSGDAIEGEFTVSFKTASVTGDRE